MISKHGQIRITSCSINYCSQYLSVDQAVALHRSLDCCVVLLR